MRSGSPMAALDRVGAHAVRAAIRGLPPRGRGMRLARAWTRISSARGAPMLSREPSGMRLRCDLRDDLSRLIFYRGWVDRALETWLSAWLRPGDTYVDVGAHVGFYVSLALAAIDHSGRVIAFEPLDDNYEKLSMSVREVSDRYANVEVHRAAVGATPGQSTLFRPTGEWEHQAYRASLVPGSNRAPHRPVPVVTLDDTLGPVACRLLKIDVEGAEVDVLRGARSFLSRRQAEAVLIELNPTALRDANTTTDELVALLSSFGYRAYEIVGATLEPRTEVEVRGEFANLVFLPTDR
jgi:FkbM family methyltransferase